MLSVFVLLNKSEVIKIDEAVRALPIAAPTGDQLVAVERICEKLYLLSAVELLTASLNHTQDLLGKLAGASLVALELILEGAVIAEYVLPHVAAASNTMVKAHHASSLSSEDAVAISAATYELETLFPVAGKGIYHVGIESLRKPRPKAPALSIDQPIRIDLPPELASLASRALSHDVGATASLVALYRDGKRTVSFPKNSFVLIVRPEQRNILPMRHYLPY